MDVSLNNSPMISSTQTRPTPRRRTSHTHSRTPVPVLPPKQSLSAEPSVAQLRNEQKVVVAKDLPPHLTPAPDAPSFDIRHDIDAFVERVRAVAMDRPHTPGSHIDWASDDADSLPDLPDWGITSTGVDSGKTNVISPILEDALRPLPSLEPGTPTIASSSDDHSDGDVHDVHEDSSITSSSPQEGSDVPCQDNLMVVGKSPVGLTCKTELDERNTGVGKDLAPDLSKLVPIPRSKSPVSKQPLSGSISPSKAGGRLPIHPSLPLKPITTAEPETSEADRQIHLPSAVSKPSFESGLGQSMHAPAQKVVLPESQSVKSQSPERGLAASMHAPVASTRSAPSHISSHSAPDLSPFQPAHSRSRASGRSLHHRQPHSTSVTNFSDHHLDSDRAGRGEMAQHARTHSSPPTGLGTSTAHTRSIHATRPVITGDAISRLARTLGGAGIPKREVVGVRD